nr:hypothetical protein [Tanacetum cinerariifolium]
MFVIEQPIPPAPAVNVLAEWYALYNAHNEVACLMLRSMTLELLDNLKSIHLMRCFRISDLCLRNKLKRRDQLERLSYVQPQDLIVGLILNGLTKDFMRFMRHYNMHNIGKTIDELHAMLIEYEKGLPKKAETPQVMMINGGKIQKSNKIILKLVELSNSLLLQTHHNIMIMLFPTRILNMVPTKKVDKTPYELWYGKVPNLSYLKVWGCEALVKRDTFGKLQQRSVKFVARYVEFFERNLITQEVGGRAIDLEEIQDEDTSPSEITSKISIEVEGFEPPQEEVILIRRSERTHRAPNCLCLNVEVEEHSLGDLYEHASYKATMLDSRFNKWIDATNAKIQSMIDNMVWVLVDLSTGCKTDGKTFSPVADIRAIRILISITVYYDYEIWQMDVKTTFLSGNLDEDIYMVQLGGFVDPNHPRKECKLQRSIYGLKQASKSWNKRFDEKIKRNPKAKLRVDCYCNARFETNIDDMKSLTRYVSF